MTVSLCAILIDIKARQVIGRTSLLENLSADDVDDDWLEFAIGCGGTIGAGLSWKGMIMTGEDVRSVGAYPSDLVGTGQSSKKKSKKIPKKVNKKPLLARGKHT